MSKTKTALMLLLAACSCTDAALDRVPAASDAPVTVGFAVAQDAAPATRSAAGSDGLSTSWVAADEISLWAARGSTLCLDAVPFTVYSLTDGGAFFTADLDTPMAEGDYAYYATYPAPVSVNGTSATFVVPARQDGLSGGGEDIMVATPANASALTAIDWQAAKQPDLSLVMNHKLHRLRFYSSDSRLAAESIQKLVLDFPRNVAGTVETDYTDPSADILFKDGASTIVVEPVSPVPLSSEDERSYLTASIVPTAFSASESMSVKLYTESKVATAVIPLQSRTFAAGHSTPVRIIPTSVSNYCRVRFNVVSNNLGEKVQSITLTAPAGAMWSDNGSETYVYNPGTDIDAGHTFSLDFEDESAFRTLSGKTVTVTYDSEHVRISENVTIENLDGRYSTGIDLNVPYLLYEDFSGVETFSSHDEYATWVTGSYSAHSFLNGWTAARAGAQSGKCIRIACRRETSSDYDARADSAPLRGILKKAADLSVEFDYGANNQYGGVAIVTDGNVGQTCHLGYVTSTDGLSSNSTEGTFEESNSFYVKEYTGTWDNTPNADSYVIHNAPASSTIRISWRTVIEHQAGTTNTTAWLYIDNVRIKINQE